MLRLSTLFSDEFLWWYLRTNHESNRKGAIMRSAVGTVSLILLAISISANAGDPDFSSDPEEINETHPPSMRAFTILSHGSRMNAIMYLANGPGLHPTVVLLHGFPGNEKNLDLAQAIRRAGWNVLFFHYRGSWGSEGLFSFANVLEDVESAIQYLLTDEHAASLRVDREKISLIGHSMGGFAALLSCANDDVICATGIAPWEAVLDTAWFADENFDKEYGDYFVSLRSFSAENVFRELKENQDKWSVASALTTSKKPILIVTGELDDTILPEVDEKTCPQCQFVEIDQADHAFSARRIQLMEVVVGWLRDHGR
jgi:uncharacterized protein